MNVPLFVVIITIVCAFVIIWLMLGFLGFLIESKINKWTELNKDLEEELNICIIFGLLSFIMMLSVLIFKSIQKLLPKIFGNIHESLKIFINKLLKKINK